MINTLTVHYTVNNEDKNFDPDFEIDNIYSGYDSIKSNYTPEDIHAMEAILSHGIIKKMVI